MKSFLQLLDGAVVDASTGEVREGGRLEVNMKDLLAAGFRDILAEKSKLYQQMTKKGVSISIDIQIPGSGFSGNIKELIETYNGDLS